MTTYVLLVRGVTPSGRNKLPMSRFREVLEKAGFTRVRTYIQSGNALVDTELPAHAVEKSVSKLIRDEIGPELVVIARTGAELEEALEANPFTEGYSLSRVFLSLLQNCHRSKRSGSFCPWISFRKNLHSITKPRICIFRVRMAGECSLLFSWRRSSESPQRCAISIR